MNLPVIVHDRDAHEDVLELLREYRPRGVVHCFSGSVEMANEILKLGMYIGVGGVITFKNARKLPEVVHNSTQYRNARVGKSFFFDSAKQIHGQYACNAAAKGQHGRADA